MHSPRGLSTPTLDIAGTEMALDTIDDDGKTCDFNGFGKLQEIIVSLNSNIRIRETRQGNLP